MKKVISTEVAGTVEELIASLKSLTLGLDESLVYTTINSDSIRLSLIQETLTDGSMVHNIELIDLCKGLS